MNRYEEHGGSNIEYSRKCVLRVYMRDTDRSHGELVQKKILDLFERSDVPGVTVFHAISGFGSTGGQGIRLYKLTTEKPIVVECVADRRQIEPLIPPIKEVLASHGMITLTETELVV